MTNDEARNRATVLDRGPREIGGVRIDVLTSMSFESQLKDLAAMLKSQYRVIYARPESLIPPERVEVSVGEAGARGARRAGARTGGQVMKRTIRAPLTLSLVLAAVAAGVPRRGSTRRRRPPQKQPPQMFRATVDVVSLNVTVVDGQNHYVTDLDEQDFSVFEDGAGRS